MRQKSIFFYQVYIERTEVNTPNTCRESYSFWVWVACHEEF